MGERKISMGEERYTRFLKATGRYSEPRRKKEKHLDSNEEVGKQFSRNIRYLLMAALVAMPLTAGNEGLEFRLFKKQISEQSQQYEREYSLIKEKKDTLSSELGIYELNGFCKSIIKIK